MGLFKSREQLLLENVFAWHFFAVPDIKTKISRFLQKKGLTLCTGLERTSLNRLHIKY